MEAISCFAFVLGDAGAVDALCSFSIPISCSHGALWAASTVSTLVVAMEGSIHKVFYAKDMSARSRDWPDRQVILKTQNQQKRTRSHSNESSSQPPSDSLLSTSSSVNFV
jgi:hypothetical protein